MDTINRLAQFTTDDADALLPHWQATMRAEAKSPGTVDTYTYGLRSYLTWCTRTGEPPLDRTSMTTWMSHQLDAGAATGSARIRKLGVRRFVAWLIDTGQIRVDPFAGIKGPRQTQKLVNPLGSTWEPSKRQIASPFRLTQARAVRCREPVEVLHFAHFGHTCFEAMTPRAA